jgi:hypothetical protein
VDPRAGLDGAVLPLIVGEVEEIVYVRKCGKRTFENSRRRMREDEVVGRWMEWRRFNSDGFCCNVRRVRRAHGRKTHQGPTGRARPPSLAFSSSA